MCNFLKFLIQNYHIIFQNLDHKQNGDRVYLMGLLKMLHSL